MARRLTTFIILAMLLGIAVGYALNLASTNVEQARTWAAHLGILTDVFLRLIKMVIAPLVFATLVSGVAHMGDLRAVGRIGGRSILLFLAFSIVALFLGMLMVNLLRPGVGLGLPLPPASSNPALGGGLGLREFVSHIVPQSIGDAVARNEILQIVVFSLFFGVGMTAAGEKAAPVLRATDALASIMLHVTNYVMLLAPVGVFGAIAAAITVQGVGILATFGELVGDFYLALALVWLVILVGAATLVGIRRLRTFGSFVREPVLIAFSTASSEAAYPKLFEELERFGLPNRVVSFVLPLGYSFNLVGTMMYCTFGTLFIAQAYGMELSLGTQVGMLLLLLVTSKGAAAVPRAALVVIAANLQHFGIPEAGLMLLLGVDVFLDMGRTATNVLGNGIAALLVAQWEGGRGEPAGVIDETA